MSARFPPASLPLARPWRSTRPFDATPHDSSCASARARDSRENASIAAPDDTRFAKAPALKERYVTPRNEAIVEKLQAFAEKSGHTMLELAFSWLASRPQVASVIAGATRVEQVEQNVKAISWVLSAEELAEIDGITK